MSFCITVLNVKNRISNVKNESKGPTVPFFIFKVLCDLYIIVTYNYLLYVKVLTSGLNSHNCIFLLHNNLIVGLVLSYQLINAMLNKCI